MPISKFDFFTDGLQPQQRQRQEFAWNLNLDDEKLWVPYGENVWFQPCSFDVTKGGFANVLKVMPGARLSKHYHTSTVHGYTLRGSWHYLEHEWVATPGTYIFEPPGELHTLVVDADQKEPMMTFFVLSAALIYVNEDNSFMAYDDGFTLLELARKHYANNGVGVDYINNLIR
jgi:2,4'-dihydroxyacetophenone dioxygenase